MAVFRPPQNCPHCGKAMKQKHRDQSKLPPSMQVYGDTFEGWEHDGDCVPPEESLLKKDLKIPKKIRDQLDDLNT